MFSIRQTAEGWQVLNAAGEVVGDVHETYDLALGVIAAELARLATLTPGEDDANAADGDGLLPERWTSTTGVAFQERLVGGRDFTECTWTWRDPGVYPLPLMHQTETDMGHFGAVVAGIADQWELRDGVVYPSGRFYDTGPGQVLRDMMLGDRRVGVSVDPTEDVEVEFRCTEYDDDGWCADGDYVFLSYEIGGLTATPFPGFPNGTIELGGTDPAAAETPETETEPVAAGGTPRFRPAPMYPPRPWFEMAEPELGSDMLVPQDDGGLAVPLTITDDLQVFGHVARDGQCHIGYPGQCVTPPQDLRLANYRATPVRCEDGSDVIAGPLITGMDHPVLTMRAGQARDAYAHNGSIWAQVAMSNGAFGTWFCGALMPDVTELQLRVLRGSQISGDWRVDETTGDLDLIAGLAVAIPGFGITRQAIAASGLGIAPVAMPRVLYRGTGERRVTLAMTSVGMVSPCPECRRRALTASATPVGSGHDLGEVLDLLHKLERRTRPMIADAAIAAGARVVRP